MKSFRRGNWMRFGYILIFCILGNIGFSQDDYTPFFEPAKVGLSKVKLSDQDHTIRTNILQINHQHLSKTDLDDHLQLNLFPDVVIDFDLTKDLLPNYKGMQVYRGKSKDPRFAHLSHYRDAVIIYNPQSRNYTAQISTDKGSFEILPTGSANEYIVTEWTQESFTCRTKDHTHLAEKKLKHFAKSGCEEKDKNGIYVADLFVGYSYDAAFIVKDYDAHALSLAEEANNGLMNSLVDNIRIRLVGTGISEHNPGVVPSVLGDVYDWFEDEIALTAADYVASVQVPTGAENEAGGWAGVGGYSSVNSVNSSAAVFRHELGHNIGSSHCTPGILPYAAGFDNGNVRTHMCGNNINFYSTPLVNDATGTPIGDAVTADNARVWRERAPVVSARQIHSVLFDDQDIGCASSLANGRYHIQNVNNDKYIGTLNESTARGNRLALADNQATSNQWDLIHMGNNKYRIQMVNNTERRIDVPGGSSAAGTDIIIWSNNGGPNQDFSIRERSTGMYTIQTPSAQCLQVENVGNTEDDPIEQNECDNSDNTMWRFVPVSGGSALSVNVTTTDITCFGNNNGNATAAVSGGTGNYTYAWSSGGTGSTETGLTSGNHTVTVSDGTTDIPYSFSIKQPEAVTTSISVIKSNGDDGAITLTAAGGTSPYIYTWSDGSTGSNIQNLAIGLFTATITDAANCAQTKEVYVPCAVSNQSCDDGNDNTVGDIYDQQCNCVGIDVTCADPSLNIINVAVGKSTNQLSISSGGESSRAVDGNISGIYNQGSVTHTATDTMPWWEVDLGESIDIQAIALWNRTDCCTGRLKQYYVLVSETPFTSDDLSTSINQAGVWSFLIENVPVRNEVVNVGSTGRYVRIQKIDRGILSLAEVQVFTCEQCTYYADSDGDGFGDPNNTVKSSCQSTPAGYADNSDDCDDNNANIIPSNTNLCADPEPSIVIANPLSNNDWEVKGRVKPNGKEITKITLDHGVNDFSNSTEIPIGSINHNDDIDLSEIINIGSSSTYQFRLIAENHGNPYTSETYTIDPNQDYCTPTDNDDLWYKRFSKIQFGDIIIEDDGNATHGVYQDATADNIGELEKESTYSIELSTPNSGWWNLTFYIYADLNNDNDFDDYHELIGSSGPTGQTTIVQFTIPSEDIVTGETLRMRIVGNEGGNHNTCFTAVGNTTDISLSIKVPDCTTQTWYADSDNDGFGNANNSKSECQQPNGYVSNSDDCDDTNDKVFPNATELCDGIDNDCDGDTDEDGLTTWYADSDNDGFGDIHNSKAECQQPTGYVSNSDDCDDTNPNSSSSTTWFIDQDEDGFGNPNGSIEACTQPMGYVLSNTDFDDTNPNIYPGAPEICDCYDNDGNGEIDEGLSTQNWYKDEDGDLYGNPDSLKLYCRQEVGYVQNDLDCDDTDANINPSTVWFADNDADGYGNPNESTTSCTQPSNYVIDDTDFDDADEYSYPDALDICDDKDNDDDGAIDEDETGTTWYEDADQDGLGNVASPLLACDQPNGYVTNAEDCNDTNSNIQTCDVETIRGTLNPNPASYLTIMELELTHMTNVDIQIIGTNASFEMNKISLTDMPSGIHQVPINISGLTSGIYFIQVRTETKLFTKRLVVQQ